MRKAAKKLRYAAEAAGSATNLKTKISQGADGNTIIELLSSLFNTSLPLLAPKCSPLPATVLFVMLVIVLFS